MENSSVIAKGSGWGQGLTIKQFHIPIVIVITQISMCANTHTMSVCKGGEIQIRSVI